MHELSVQYVSEIYLKIIYFTFSVELRLFLQTFVVNGAYHPNFSSMTLVKALRNAGEYLLVQIFIA